MKRIALLLLLPLLAGCGTLLDAGTVGPRIYGGFRRDLATVAGEPVILRPHESERTPHGFPRYVAGFDLPCSLLMDTLLLPYTLIRALVVDDDPVPPPPPR